MSVAQNRIYTISICLSDIPAHKIVTAGKSNKMYCEMVVADKKEQDQYGFDAKVYCKQTEDERKATDAKKDYIGRGKAASFTADGKLSDEPLLRNRIYTINVCLSDIPPGAVKLWEKEGSASFGKAYIDLCVADKKEADKYGFDVSVYVRQSKEDREQNKDRVYCGRGKMDIFGGGGTPMAANPWAVGSAGAGAGDNSHGPDAGDEWDKYNADRDAQYQGSGFNNGNADGANKAADGSTFFGGGVTVDDLPF